MIAGLLLLRIEPLAICESGYGHKWAAIDSIYVVYDVSVYSLYACIFCALIDGCISITAVGELMHRQLQDRRSVSLLVLFIVGAVSFFMHTALANTLVYTYPAEFKECASEPSAVMYASNVICIVTMFAVCSAYMLCAPKRTDAQWERHLATPF